MLVVTVGLVLWSDSNSQLHVGSLRLTIPPDAVLVFDQISLSCRSGFWSIVAEKSIHLLVVVMFGGNPLENPWI